MSVAEAVWLIWATEGEYSWPVCVCMDEATGQAAAVRMKQLWRDLQAIYKLREDELDAIDDWSGETLWETTDEGRELFALTGAQGDLGGCYADERDYTCCEVSVLKALERVDGEGGVK